jgi:hypothetical protein
MLCFGWRGFGIERLAADLKDLSRMGMMNDLVAWVILFLSPLSTPPDSPTIVFVPEPVLNWVSLPEADYGCRLVGTHTVKGDRLLMDVDELQDTVLDPGRGNLILRVLVDWRRFSPHEIAATFSRIRQGWKTKTKAVIYVELCEIIDCSEETVCPEMRELLRCLRPIR